MESKKINQLATELAPDLSDITIIGDPTTGISKKITLSQMASLFTGTVEEYATLAAFPLVGVADTIYIALDTNVIYRYDTSLSAYVILSPNVINSLVFSDANGFDGTITLVGSVATLSITTALTLGSVPFIGASGALTQDNSNLFFDDTNNRLGIATALPTTPLDVFGSGIIGRLNATSTNNSFLGFASAGTNKWSIGNVQSDHRFRIYNEATTSELVSVLSTGEFGIGIANPTTKFHIDGAASALIANLDANVSVAKSISFRSDNSNRINLEVSGTESGSNAGANIFLRTFTDAGSLLETPFSIVRSTGVTTIKSLTLTNALSVANGGTGSTTQNFVDLTTTQSIGGLKTFTGALSGTSATFTSIVSSTSLDVISASGVGTSPASGLARFITAATTDAISIGQSNNTRTINLSSYYIFGQGNDNYCGTTSAHDYIFYTNSTEKMIIKSGGNVGIGTSSPGYKLDIYGGASGTRTDIQIANAAGNYNIGVLSDNNGFASSTNSMLFYTAANERMRIEANGDIKSVGVYNNTTSNSANMYIFSDGSFSRSTSSLRFKTDVETLDNNISETIYKMRPIWYRSLCEKDRRNWSWYGFGAEELAKLEPRLVHWGYKKEDYVINEETKEQELKEGAELQADGVQYERITVLLVAEMQKMNKAIQKQKVQIEELKALIAAK